MPSHGKVVRQVVLGDFSMLLKKLNALALSFRHIPIKHTEEVDSLKKARLIGSILVT